METLTRRSAQILKMLCEKGKSTTTYSLHTKQDELAKQLGISRQALNAHLRKLRNLKYVRTGRGFIDVTEEGLKTLGISATPAFILIKVSPHRRSEAYEQIMKLKIERAFRVAGDVDALLVVGREKLDRALKDLSLIRGLQDTKSYVAIESIK